MRIKTKICNSFQIIVDNIDRSENEWFEKFCSNK